MRPERLYLLDIVEAADRVAIHVGGRKRSRGARKDIPMEGTSYPLFVSKVTKQPSRSRELLDRFVRVLAPFAPHLCEELCQRMGNTDKVAPVAWPAHDPALLVEDTVTMPVQVNGKLRAKLTLPRGADQATVQAAADANVAKYLEGVTIRKVIRVKDKRLNLVVG